ncbi:hypothetical protein HPB48_017180 [Haemaphysalis longicornis]|uniref:Alpha-latrotoxin n=1 Tax=Haemaphysalis longicornis TaxID=44386 RepID=A0A9J6GLP3_HAELO|nr:hypothetical protein HPB48_017180 [Haemaphysalis longicornis]
MDFTEVWSNTRSTVSMAVVSSDAAALKEMIDSGKPVDVQDNRGWRPLHEAAAAGCSVEALDLLLKHADTDVNWRTFEGETALLLACKRLRGKTLLDTVNRLLGSSADVNITDHEGDSPLLAAIRAGETDVVRQLLCVGGADVNAGDSGFWCPMHEAETERGDLATLQCLVEYGRPHPASGGARRVPHDAHLRGRTGGHLACLQYLLGRRQGDWWKGHEACVELLLRYGADPNRTTTDNVTGLHLAAQSNAVRCLKLLLAAMDLKKLQTDCLHPFQRSETDPPLEGFEPMLPPFHIAIEWARQVAPTFLYKLAMFAPLYPAVVGRPANAHARGPNHCPNDRHDCMIFGGSAVSVGASECLSELLRSGFEVDRYLLRVTTLLKQLPRHLHPHYHTALSYAVLKGDPASARILLDAGASPNHIGDECVSPMACALVLATDQLLRMLVAAGGDLNRLNRTVSHGNPCLQVSVSDRDRLIRVLRMGLDPALWLDTEMGSLKLATCIFHPQGDNEHALAVVWILRAFVASPWLLQNLVRNCLKVGPRRCQVNRELWSAMMESLSTYAQSLPPRCAWSPY